MGIAPQESEIWKSDWAYHESTFFVVSYRAVRQLGGLKMPLDFLGSLPRVADVKAGENWVHLQPLHLVFGLVLEQVQAASGPARCSFPAHLKN